MTENSHMSPWANAYSQAAWQETRRGFLTSAASGLGWAALASLLQNEKVRAADRKSADSTVVNPLALRPPHFPGKAKSCIFIFLAGGTSHIELFDPKPKLNELSGQAIPESFTKDVRFSFLKLNQSVLMGSPFKFRKYGESGLELSELLPNIGACADDLCVIRSMHHQAFDHAPGELMMSTGKDIPGRPSTGAWLSYGLGSESEDLPGYVVLMNGRGPVARAMAWGSGFLPSVYQGVVLRGQGEPILNLETPPGVSRDADRLQLDALGKLNRLRFDQVRDPEIESKIASYELAFRMQASAPELIDLSRETAQTQEAYGVNRNGESGAFARNCLLARRLVERGVRFVTLFQRKWDQHKNLAGDLKQNCHEVDQPVGALLKDLKQRGLLDSTVVVWGTEFGRTPLTENSKPGDGAGRDHHPHGYSVWLAGGGVKGGQTIGATDELGWNAVDERVHVNDFHATLLHLFGLTHTRLTYRYNGLDFRLTDLAGKVVSKIFS